MSNNLMPTLVCGHNALHASEITCVYFTGLTTEVIEKCGNIDLRYCVRAHKNGHTIPYTISPDPDDFDPCEVGVYTFYYTADGYTESRTVFVTENVKEPYFLKSFENIGFPVNAEHDTIVGGSAVWNQLIKNGNFADGTNDWTKDNNDFNFTANNGYAVLSIVDNTSSNHPNIRPTSVKPPIAGHKYMFSIRADTSLYETKSVELRFKYGGDNVIFSTSENLRWGWKYVIFECPSNITETSGELYISDPCSAFHKHDVFVYYNVQLIDLTLMLGNEIANYAYNLEQQQDEDYLSPKGGKGVKWLFKNYPKLRVYNAYNLGTIESVGGLVSHDMIGFNQWDEEWEVGSYDNQGNPIASADTIRSKNPIEIIPNTENGLNLYWFNCPGIYLYFYDVDDNFLSYTATPISHESGELNKTAAKFRFRTANGYGTTYNNDICINVYNQDKNGTYEPYSKTSYPLDNNIVLRGIPKLDADNKLYYDGDIYESDGTVTRKYGVVDLGTLDWTYQSQYTRFYSSDIYSLIKRPSTNNEQINALCLKYTQSSSNGTASQYNNNTFGVGTGGSVLIRDESYSDKNTFTSAMSGVYLIYELATPTTETADPYANPQTIDPYGTEEYVTTSLVPVGHDSRYDII